MDVQADMLTRFGTAFVAGLGIILSGCANPTPSIATSSTTAAAATTVTSTAMPSRAADISDDPAHFQTGGFTPDRSQWWHASGPYFTTPTGNIACAITVTLMCDVFVHDFPDPPKPDPCFGNWVPGWVSFSANDVELGACRGDPGVARYANVLEYNHSVSANGVTCVSRPEALYCRLADGRGATLSRQAVLTGPGAGVPPA